MSSDIDMHDSPRFNFDPETGTIMRRKVAQADIGSVRSTKSLGGVSIFQDPDAGAAMPRDEEITFTMYDRIEEPRESVTYERLEPQGARESISGYSIRGDEHTASTVMATHAEESSTPSTRKSSVIEVKATSSKAGPTMNGPSTENGVEMNGHLSTERSESRAKHTSAATSKNIASTKRAAQPGSFQMRFGTAYVNASEPDLVYKKSQGADTPSQRLSGQFDSSTAHTHGPNDADAKFNTGSTQSLLSSHSTLASTALSTKRSSHASNTDKDSLKGYEVNPQGMMNGDFSVERSDGEINAYGEVSTLKTATGQRPRRLESDLTSVSSLDSASLLDSLDKRYDKAARSRDSRSESPHSVRSLSKAPSLSSVNEQGQMTVRDIDIKVTQAGEERKGSGFNSLSTSFRSSGSKLEIQDKKQLLTSRSKSQDRGISATSSQSGSFRFNAKPELSRSSSQSSVSQSHVTRSEDPPMMAKGSSQSSIVLNQEFRDKMAALFAGSGSRQVSRQTSVSSTATSTLARSQPEQVYRSDTQLAIFPTEKNTPPASDNYSSTFPRGSGESDKPVSSFTRSPVHEMSGVIKTGTVGTLVKDKFKNLNLTGRSLSQSTLALSANQSEDESLSGSKYKFALAGIDTDKPEIKHKEDANNENEEAQAVNGEVEIRESSSLPRRDVRKSGFSYVMDKQLQSEILKKASDVTARKPHESLERKSQLTRQEEAKESDVLVKAKSRLSHKEETRDKPTSEDARVAMLLKIRSRLASPTPVVASTSTYHQSSYSYSEKEPASTYEWQEASSPQGGSTLDREKSRKVSDISDKSETFKSRNSRSPDASLERHQAVIKKRETSPPARTTYSTSYSKTTVTENKRKSSMESDRSSKPAADRYRDFASRFTVTPDPTYVDTSRQRLHSYDRDFVTHTRDFSRPTERNKEAYGRHGRINRDNIDFRADEEVEFKPTSVTYEPVEETSSPVSTLTRNITQENKSETAPIDSSLRAGYQNKNVTLNDFNFSMPKSYYEQDRPGDEIEIGEDTISSPPAPELPKQPPPYFSLDKPEEEAHLLSDDDKDSVSSSSTLDGGKEVNELHLSQQQLVYDGASYELRESGNESNVPKYEPDHLSNLYNSRPLAQTTNTPRSQKIESESKDGKQSHSHSGGNMASSNTAHSLREISKSSYSPQRNESSSHVDTSPTGNATSTHHTRITVERVPKSSTKGVEDLEMNATGSHSFKDKAPSVRQRREYKNEERQRGVSHSSDRRHVSRIEVEDWDRASVASSVNSTVSKDSTVKASSVVSGQGALYIELSDHNTASRPYRGHTSAHAHNHRSDSYRSHSSSALSSPRGHPTTSSTRERTRIRSRSTDRYISPRSNVYSPQYIDIPVLDVGSEPESPRSGLLLVRQSATRSPLHSPNAVNSGYIDRPRYRGMSVERDVLHSQPQTRSNKRHRTSSQPPGVSRLHVHLSQSPPGYDHQREHLLRSHSGSSTAASAQSVPVTHTRRTRPPHRSPRQGGHFLRYTVSPCSPPNVSASSDYVSHLPPSGTTRIVSTGVPLASPSGSNMTSPGIMMSDYEVFETSHMNGVSTMGRRIQLDNSHGMHDENMNYKPTRTRRSEIRVDESRGGRMPSGTGGVRISTINIDGEDSFDVHSTVSEPAAQHGHPSSIRRSRVRNIMERRSMTTRPANPIPVVAVHRTENVELDPHLDEAHRTGNQYNVSLKLNANVVGASEESSVIASPSSGLLQQEYVEHDMYNSTTMDHHRSAALSPRDTHSSVSSGSTALHSPGRSKTNIRFLDNEPLSPGLLAEQSSTIDHLRIRQQVNAPPVIQTATRNHQHIHRDAYVIKSSIIGTSNQQNHHQQPMRYPSGQSGGNAPPRSSNGEPKFSMSINDTMTMDYVHAQDEDEQPIQPQKVRKQQRRKIVNGDGARPPRRKVRHTDDDLEQYFSPAEEGGMDEAYTGIPNFERGSMLYRNYIDTTGAARVVDVVEEDSDEDIDIAANVNPFHDNFRDYRENPLYASDPDLSKAGVSSAGRIPSKKHQPQYVEHSSEETTRQKNGRLAELEKQRYDTEIKVTRANSSPDKRSRHNTSSRSETYVYNGYDLPSRQQQQQQQHQNRSSTSRSVTRHSSSGRDRDRLDSSRSEFEISRLLKDAPPDSIKQTINVEREEEEIIGPLPEGGASGGQDVDSMLNFDTISEKVDLGIREGTAQVAVKVRCERIVPIQGVHDMFKKSSVIVTRLIEIDLLATHERKRLYDHITSRSKNSRSVALDKGEHRVVRGAGHLSTKDTFRLYKTFMGMAEADESGRQNIRIDRKVEETRGRPHGLGDGFEIGDADEDIGFDIDDLDARLEAQTIQRAMRPPEPDTISFMSALSETEGMMY